MRVKHLSLNQWLALAVFLAATLSFALSVPMAAQNTDHATDQGSGVIPPRPAASDYPSKATQEKTQIGAELVGKKELKKIFITDVNQCCVVVEVGFYPQKDSSIKISSADFVLREAGSDLTTRASSAKDVARSLGTSSKEAYHAHGPVVTKTQEIGYGRTTGNLPADPTDPGRTKNRIYERSGVGAGVGLGKEPSGSSSSGTDNRQTMETELDQKALPEVTADQPVAGYLYFFIPKKNKGYELVYTIGEKKVVLSLK
jgi:hypothetical protein